MYRTDSYRNIEIHSVDAAGVVRRINSFRGDNDAVRAAGMDIETKRAALLEIALRMVDKWRAVITDRTIYLAEVEDPRVFCPEGKANGKAIRVQRPRRSAPGAAGAQQPQQDSGGAPSGTMSNGVVAGGNPVGGA